MPHSTNDHFGFIHELTGFKSVLPLTENTDTARPEAGSAEALATQKKNAEQLNAAIQQNPDYVIVAGSWRLEYPEICYQGRH